MRVSGVLVVLLALLVVGCTFGDDAPPGPEDAGGDATTAPVVPTPGPTATSDVDEIAFGTGTVTVDGTELPVSGDCDISRGFGDEPVGTLDEDVDVLLAVDNITRDGGHDGPFAVRVRLLDGGAVPGRTITSVGAPGSDGATTDATYEGTVDVAELRDRREVEFLDVAVLHLEAAQEHVGGGDGASTRQLVVDVTCPVSRPQ